MRLEHSSRRGAGTGRCVRFFACMLSAGELAGLLDLTKGVDRGRNFLREQGVNFRGIKRQNTDWNRRTSQVIPSFVPESYDSFPSFPTSFETEVFGSASGWMGAEGENGPRYRGAKRGFRMRKNRCDCARNHLNRACECFVTGDSISTDWQRMLCEPGGRRTQQLSTNEKA